MNKFRKVFSIVGFILVFVLLFPSIGLAANSDSTKSDASNVQGDINQLNAEMTKAVDDYNQAHDKLVALDNDIDSNQSELTRVAKELGKSLQILNKRAAGIYKHGNVSSFEVVLGSKSVTDLVERLDLVTRIGNRDAEIVRQVKSQKREVETKAHELKAKREQQDTLTAQLATQKDAINAKLTDKTNVLASLLQQVADMDAQQAADAARRRAQPGGGTHRSGAKLTAVLDNLGAYWGSWAPGQWSDHGPSGHGVWLHGDAYDLMCGDGAVVYAAHSGTITEVGDGRYGWTILEGEGYTTCYAHCGHYYSAGKSVSAGDPIGMTQGFGHLHFELIDNGQAIPAGDYPDYF